MNDGVETMNDTITVVSPKADSLVRDYIALRDKVADIKKAHSAQLAPYNDMMASIEVLLLDTLATNKAESMRTDNGTFYKSVQASVKVKEWAETLAFIQENEYWDLLEARVSKVAAEALVAETKTGIPGVDISRMVRVNVRRSD